MKNILTIDFDIIMDNSIELYNSMGMPWEERFQRHPVLKTLPMEATHFQRITQFLIQLYTTIEIDKVHFIEQHHKILDYLTDDEYHIINVDHHHDWAYKDIDFEKPIEKVDCGNWVKALSDQGKLLSYTWIKNETSIGPKEEQNFTIYNLKDCTLFNFSNIDEVYIVLSPEFVPPYYYSLFYIWLDIANGAYNTHFEVDY